MTEVLAHRSFDILHFPGREVVFSNNSSVLLNRGEVEKFLSDPFLDLQYEYTITVDGTDFFLKPKVRNDVVSPKAMLGIPEDEPVPRRLKNALSWEQRRRSVLHEMSISPEIREIIEAPDCQKIAHKYGFKDVTFTEPLAAVVDRVKGRRSILYPDIANGYTLGFYFSTGGFNLSSRDKWGRSNLTKMLNEIEKALLKNGILADDLTSKNVLADQEGHLYLIDTELYQRA